MMKNNPNVNFFYLIYIVEFTNWAIWCGKKHDPLPIIPNNPQHDKNIKEGMSRAKYIDFWHTLLSKMYVNW